MPYWFSVVAARNSAQLLNVEVGVLDLQRIEGPLDQLDALLQRDLALKQLEPRADTGIPMRPGAPPACGNAGRCGRCGTPGRP